MMNQSLSDLLGVNSMPPIGSIHMLPDNTDGFGVQRTMGRTYLRAGTLARAALFPAMPSHLKPVGLMATKSSQPLNAPIGDMASDGKNTVIAIAYDSTVFASLDAGDTWINRGKISVSYGLAWSVATDGNGVWIAMARDGMVVRSTDGFASWSTALTPAQAALVGVTTYACRLDYVNGEFWVSRTNIALSSGAANNNHLYRLSSSGAMLTSVSLPATGVASGNNYLCGVFGNGKSLFAIFNMAGLLPAAPGTNTWTLAYRFDASTGTFSVPFGICGQPAMSMTWADSQQLWLVYGNNVYGSSNIYYGMDVRLYDADLKLVASWQPAVVTSLQEGYYPSTPVGEVTAWGEWGVFLRPNRNVCLDYYGRSGAASNYFCYFSQRPLGGRIETATYSYNSGSGVKISRDLVLVHQNNLTRDVYRINSYVGLPSVNKPSADTSMFMRVG